MSPVTLNKKPPGPTSSLELLKNALALQKDPFQQIKKLKQQYGDIVYYSWPNKMCLLFNPAHIQWILQDNHKNYHKSLIYDEFKPVFGKGLVTSEDELWIKQRRVVGEEFRPKSTLNFFPVMVKRTAEMLNSLEKNKATFIDISDEFIKVTFNIAGESFLGSSLDKHSLEFSEALLGAFEIGINRVYTLLRIPDFIPTPENIKFNNYMKTLDKFIYSFIDRNNNSDKTNVLSRLLNARDEATGEPMSRQQLRDEVLTLLAAGHETTSNALTWCIYLLCHNPEIKEKLFSEISRVLGDKIPEYEDLDKIEYLKLVIMESLRKIPPVPMFSRTPITVDQIGSYDINTDMTVACIPFITHNDPDYWDSPDNFIPERFTDEENTRRQKFTFFPFALGPRKCIGMDFAIAELKTILIMFLQKYDFELQPGFTPKMFVGITLQTKNGMMVKLIPR
jgi:cytochrome P450